MRALATIIPKCVWIPLLTVFPVTGLAHTLEAPATVQAAADGSFSYEIVFTVGPGSVLIAGSGWTGVQNVPDQLHGDCFCFAPGCTAEEGEVSVLLVTSTLGDPTAPGLVRNWVAFCLESDIETFTTILPPFDGCGTLVQGAECVFFQADIGGLFRLEDYGGFNVGDVVRVTGVLNPDCTTICLQGDGCIQSNTIASCLPVPGGPVLDIKPRSCPNPFNVQLFEFQGNGQPVKGGVLPVALLGTSEFDVSQVDVSSIRLVGVEPLLRGGGPKIEDITAPTANGDDCGCIRTGPDGIADLMMHFSGLEIAAAIAPGEPGDQLVLTLTGTLLDGTPFEGRDCIVFVGPKADASPIVINNPETQLGAASPNPFNPVTRIRYVLSKQGRVRLVVYNVKGQRVATLVNDVMPSGEHIVTWNAKGVSSGVYFYRLTAGDFSETRRMVLLK